MTGNVCSELCIYKGRHVETGSVHAKDQDDSDRGQVHGPPEGQLLGGHDPADCLAALIDDINSGYENDQQDQKPEISLIDDECEEAPVKEDPGIEPGKGRAQKPEHGSRVRSHIAVASYGDDKEGADHLEQLPARRFIPDMEKAPEVRVGLFKQGLCRDECGVINAVDHIFPVRSVPDPDEDKDNKGSEEGGKYLAEVGSDLFPEALLHPGKGL